MKKSMEQTMAVDAASVSRVAYELWENAGRPVGRDLEFWLAAEARVRASSTQANGSAGAELTAVTPRETKPQRATRPVRGGIKKTWPKPYPTLPKF